ncbi:hypothetical protein EVAR_52064_1 [Eumeta japonica]|uniref:Uncharacterized protein n=1 Tax=Eumeta variegata TaxID=151549 RepID=A0A4C1Y4V5_EUMVA|nr:hypothetical protein EVAR_52064_1 [Eumeta japonica]
MEQRSLPVFGLNEIFLSTGLMMDLLNFQVHYQTLKANHGQNIFQGNSNRPEYRSDVILLWSTSAYLSAASSDLKSHS